MASALSAFDPTQIRCIRRSHLKLRAGSVAGSNAWRLPGGGGSPQSKDIEELKEAAKKVARSLGAIEYDIKDIKENRLGSIEKDIKEIKENRLGSIEKDVKEIKEIVTPSFKTVMEKAWSVIMHLLAVGTFILLCLMYRVMMKA